MRCDQANGENAARSARAPLKNGAAVRRSRLKIATDVAGMLGSIAATKIWKTWNRKMRMKISWTFLDIGDSARKPQGEAALTISPNYTHRFQFMFARYGLCQICRGRTETWIRLEND